MNALRRATGLLALVWGAHWTTFGCRISGIEFGYFLAWLPEGVAVERSWLANTLSSAALHLAVPLFGLLLHRAREHGDEGEPERAGGAGPLTAIAQLKLGFVLAFILGFAHRGVVIGPEVLSDTLSEGAFWIVVLVTLLFAEPAWAPRAAASEERAKEEPPDGLPAEGSSIQAAS